MRQRRRFPASAFEAGQRFLAVNATQEVAKRAAALVAAGTHRWRWDPEVPDVVGLTLVERPTRAVVIVYLADCDFEVDEDVFA